MNYIKNESEEISNFIISKKSNYWIEKREKCSIAIFHAVAERVPAYKQFLKANNINPNKITNWADFLKVPTINKDNYLKKFSLAEKCWDGSLKKPGVLTATSGSTGEPVYFLRDGNLDWQYSIIIENFLKQNSLSIKEPTLVIVCFGMGLWIAGVITYKGFELASIRNNYPISIITPGINKRDIFNALKNIGNQFNQVIFAGYPPFIKDIFDGASEQDMNLAKFNIRVLCAAESISEEFRNYIAEKASIKNIYKDIINIYGSADIGAMAFEAGISIWVKQKCKIDKTLFNSIFSPINKTPTLAQFIPDFINFEAVDGELFLTGNSSIPLVRYAIGDNGGVFSYDELVSKFTNHGLDLDEQLSKEGLSDLKCELPFVYVYERKDLSATFYGLLIFPEWIRPALLEKGVREIVTGKFTLITKYDELNNQYLEINVETRKGIKIIKKTEKFILDRVVNQLQKVSSEYREILNNLKLNAYPKLKFWPAEDPLYFPPGSKQRWVIKNEL